MKSQKTNAFQLAIAGGVLVLVLICATFAWFAVGKHATLSSIISSVSSPKVPSQFNSIEYEQSNNVWSEYTGQHLDLVPGKSWKFKVNFTAKPTDILTMSLTQISAEIREFESESDVHNGEDTETSSAPAPSYDPVIEPDMLSEVLWVRVNDGEPKKLNVDASTSTAVILGADSGEVGVLPGYEDQPDVATQYVYTYEIIMDKESGNKYMDKELSFIFEADLISKEEADSESEG